MQKKFNITGLCRPNEHYMVDISQKFAETMDLVTFGEYFIINRPRQYGKTTMLYMLERELIKTENYLVFNISFEGIGDVFFWEEKVFAPGFIRLLQKQANYHTPVLLPILKELEQQTHTMEDLADAITVLMNQTEKKVVLLIDEVDKSSNNQLFISFLAMLRNKYLERDRIKTFHSVVLAGVHDVKSLKLKMRPDEEQKFNSPWNIAAEYKVDLNFYPHEIKPMLDEYVIVKNVKMDTQAIADCLFYYTSGYPFLVSKLCKMLDEDFKPAKTEWTENDIEMAVNQLVGESNTNFDTLTKNLENNPELYKLVYHIAIDNNTLPFNVHNPTSNLGMLYGIFANKNGLKIHNRIYNEVLIEYMSFGVLEKNISKLDAGSGYKNDDNTLNMHAIMLGFQAFMKKEYNRKDRDFLEKNGRLVFLAFLKPIINGSGYDFKEPQISEEKRLDVVITHLNNKYVVELKLWRGEKAHQKGLLQLHDYLDRQALKEGYLLIFDHSEVKNWQSEALKVGEKDILAVWV